MPVPRFIERWILVALATVCAASVAALFAFLGWPFELFSHFDVQLAAAAALLTAALLPLRRPRLATLAASLTALNLLHVGSLWRSAEAVPSCSGTDLVVVTANVEYSNPDRRRFLDWLAAHPADIVVVQEVTAAWARDLAAQQRYPNQRIVVREDPYGIAILSRWPLEALAPEDLAGDGLPSLTGVVDVGGQRLQLLGLHTPWPVTPGLAAARDRALLRAAARARATTLPTIAAGDLNLTPGSPVFDRLLRESGLRDAFAGDRGWHPTWMAGFWPLALRIDHALVSPGLCVERAEVGPEIGSDHRPVLVRLRLTSGP